ncbi:MAG: MarR family transcriptional regulator [Nitrospirae bacterium]|nr:MarR family transcriptional regulator [Nitrospirota bacterium]NTW65931.1 MarR family transcriptional regulator [Nitrospirota bacterium]
MGTKYEGTKKEKRALDAFIKLVRAAQSVSDRVESPFSEIGLSVSQFGVLEALHHLGPLYQKDLASKILKSTSNITMVVDNLEKQDLVERVRDEQDRRHYSVRITAKGSALITSFFPGHVRRIVNEMSVLTKAEQDELGRLCRKVGLQERNAKG